MYFFPSHSGILDKKQNHSESCSNKWSFGICMRGQFLYTHVQSRALVWLNVTVIVTLLIPFVFSTECDHWQHRKSKHQLCKLLASAYCLLYQTVATGWMTDQMFTEKGYYIYSDQIKIEAGLLVLLIVTMTTFNGLSN